MNGILRFDLEGVGLAQRKRSGHSPSCPRLELGVAPFMNKFWELTQKYPWFNLICFVSVTQKGIKIYDCVILIAKMIYSVCDAVLKLHQLQLRSFWTFPILRHPQGNQKQPSLKKLILFELFCLVGLIRERIVAHRSIDQRRIAPNFSLFKKKKQNFWQQIVSIKVFLKCKKFEVSEKI